MANKWGSPEVRAVFNQYPADIKPKLLFLRKLIIDTAAVTSGVASLEETLKWSEPAYLCKSGSTIRISDIHNDPGKYAMYFNCRTTLIDTFKEIYNDNFQFDGNRAIILSIDDAIDVEALKHCIILALTYHKIKHLPLLGA